MPSGLSSKAALGWATLILCGVALYVSWPLWPALVLAAWTAALVHPLVARFERAFRGRRRAAGVLVFLLFLVVITPVALMGVGVVVGARQLFDVLSTATSAEGALEWIAVGGTDAGGVSLPRSASELMDLIRRYGAEGLDLLTDIAGAAAKGVLVVFIYFTATFMFMFEGTSEWSWVKRHSPLRPQHLDRLTAAFEETGRGLLIGVGLTSLVQGIVATIAYVALGVSQAWVLGPITGIVGMVPVVGSALIWGPIAIGLLLTGHPVKAAILGVIGLAVIGTVDNVLRPVFSRMGALHMPMLVLFVSLFGGLMMFGPWGAIIGPLVVRLAMEGLVMLREADGEAEI